MFIEASIHRIPLNKILIYVSLMAQRFFFFIAYRWQGQWAAAWYMPNIWVDIYVHQTSRAVSFLQFNCFSCLAAAQYHFCIYIHMRTCKTSQVNTYACTYIYTRHVVSGTQSCSIYIYLYRGKYTKCLMYVLGVNVCSLCSYY